jgi:hypothetical protein
LFALIANGAIAQTTITFDDLYTDLGPGIVDTYDDVAPFYRSEGITISADEPVYLGGGLSNGDPGNFDIEGTNGPAFLTLFRSDLGGSITLSFDQTSDVSLDTIINDNAEGSSSVYTIHGYRDGSPVFSFGRIFVDPQGDPDGRVVSYEFERVDTLVFELDDSSWRILAFDNITFTPSGEPGTCRADFNNDGETDFFDLSQFLQELNAGCP